MRQGRASRKGVCPGQASLEDMRVYAIVLHTNKATDMQGSGI